ncbi:MAG: DEAD/DEAH box helicase [Pirellulaceae bacterium]|nr:DEAD/DEAH box helicase [Pirellulaceae bacterium]
MNKTLHGQVQRGTVESDQGLGMAYSQQGDSQQVGSESQLALSDTGSGVPQPAGLTAQEELLLQQLQQARFWRAQHEAVDAGETNNRPDVGIPDSWELTQGLTLHDWQQRCVDAWFAAGKRGVLKVVTGAGKTILALAIAERLQQSHRPTLRVAIVVPTVVLLNQWQDELAAHSNLPTSAIGLLGGGHGDSFSQRTRLLICVLNSAARKLPAEVTKAGVSEDLLLIVDECHRAGASEMKRVFDTPRAFSLGLSATPERENDSADDDDTADAPSDPTVDFDESVLGRKLGPVVFEMNYAEAIRVGVLPPFQIVHYGLSLGPKERVKYERLSRDITDLRSELERGGRRGLALIRWCRSRAGAANPKAVRFLSLTSERKRLLYRTDERLRAVLAILDRAFANNPLTKAILFHESIDEVMHLFDRLRESGYPVVAEHSGFPDAMRAESLHLFRQGTARVIVSARSLIEGFNVPSADLGIIVAASASVRQRVQTLGRLLRRNRAADGSEKKATLYVLYTADTVDEMIYAKADWEEFVGADRNDYFRWDSVAGTEPTPCDNPPRRPPIDETCVDASALVPGAAYPGDPDQGALYSLDTQGTIRDESGNLVKPHEQLMTLVKSYCPTGGRFKVTPRNHYVTKLEKTAEGWQAVYLGRLEEPIEVIEARRDNDHNVELTPGAPYPLVLAKGKTFSVLQRDKRLIARKVSGRVEFVLPADKLEDKEKQAALRQIQQHLVHVYAHGRPISKITVTDTGHVVYVYQNQAFFVGQAPEGADGFVFEDKKH